MLTALLAFSASFILIGTIGILVFNRSSAYRRLSQIGVSQNPVLLGLTGTSRSARMEKLLVPFQRVVPRSAKEVSNLRKLLARAGYREARHVNTYYSAKVLVPSFLCLLA